MSNESENMEIAQPNEGASTKKKMMIIEKSGTTVTGMSGGLTDLGERGTILRIPNDLDATAGIVETAIEAEKGRDGTEFVIGSADIERAGQEVEAHVGTKDEIDTTDNPQARTIGEDLTTGIILLKDGVDLDRRRIRQTAMTITSIVHHIGHVNINARRSGTRIPALHLLHLDRGSAIQRIVGKQKLLRVIMLQMTRIRIH